MAVFVLKTLAMLNVIVWVRWTLPRIRIDQMMTLCWKYLVPFAFVAFVATLLWQILVTRIPAVSMATGVALTAIAIVLAGVFLRLTKQNISAVGDRVDLTNW
jgi:NADH-quinone oxidoreductase subunit H